MWEPENWSACRQQTVRQPVSMKTRWSAYLLKALGVENKQNNTLVGLLCWHNRFVLKKGLLTDDQEAHSFSYWPVGELQPDATEMEESSPLSPYIKLYIVLGCVCLCYINVQGEEGKCNKPPKKFLPLLISLPATLTPQRGTDMFNDLWLPVISDYSVLIVPAAGENPTASHLL